MTVEEEWIETAFCSGWRRSSGLSLLIIILIACSYVNNPDYLHGRTVPAGTSTTSGAAAIQAQAIVEDTLNHTRSAPRPNPPAASVVQAALQPTPAAADAHQVPWLEGLLRPGHFDRVIPLMQSQSFSLVPDEELPRSQIDLDATLRDVQGQVDIDFLRMALFRSKPVGTRPRVRRNPLVASPALWTAVASQLRGHLDGLAGDASCSPCRRMQLKMLRQQSALARSCSTLQESKGGTTGITLPASLPGVGSLQWLVLHNMWNAMGGEPVKLYFGFKPIKGRTTAQLRVWFFANVLLQAMIASASAVGDTVSTSKTLLAQLQKLRQDTLARGQIPYGVDMAVPSSALFLLTLILGTFAADSDSTCDCILVESYNYKMRAGFSSKLGSELLLQERLPKVLCLQEVQAAGIGEAFAEAFECSTSFTFMSLLQDLVGSSKGWAAAAVDSESVGASPGHAGEGTVGEHCRDDEEEEDSQEVQMARGSARACAAQHGSNRRSSVRTTRSTTTTGTTAATTTTTSCSYSATSSAGHSSSALSALHVPLSASISIGFGLQLSAQDITLMSESPVASVSSDRKVSPWYSFDAMDSAVLAAEDSEAGTAPSMPSQSWSSGLVHRADAEEQEEEGEEADEADGSRNTAGARAGLGASNETYGDDANEEGRESGGLQEDGAMMDAVESLLPDASVDAASQGAGFVRRVLRHARVERYPAGGLPQGISPMTMPVHGDNAGRRGLGQVSLSVRQAPRGSLLGERDPPRRGGPRLASAAPVATGGSAGTLPTSPAVVAQQRRIQSYLPLFRHTTDNETSYHYRPTSLIHRCLHNKRGKNKSVEVDYHKVTKSLDTVKSELGQLFSSLDDNRCAAPAIRLEITYELPALPAAARARDDESLGQLPLVLNELVTNAVQTFGERLQVRARKPIVDLLKISAATHFFVATSAIGVMQQIARLPTRHVDRNEELPLLLESLRISCGVLTRFFTGGGFYRSGFSFARLLLAHGRIGTTIEFLPTSLKNHIENFCEKMRRLQAGGKPSNSERSPSEMWMEGVKRSLSEMWMDKIRAYVTSPPEFKILPGSSMITIFSSPLAPLSWHFIGNPFSLRSYLPGSAVAMETEEAPRTQELWPASQSLAAAAAARRVMEQQSPLTTPQPTVGGDQGAAAAPAAEAMEEVSLLSPLAVSATAASAATTATPLQTPASGTHAAARVHTLAPLASTGLDDGVGEALMADDLDDQVFLQAVESTEARSRAVRFFPEEAGAQGINGACGRVTSLLSPSGSITIQAQERLADRQRTKDLDTFINSAYFCGACNENFGSRDELLQHTSSARHSSTPAADTRLQARLRLRTIIDCTSAVPGLPDLDNDQRRIAKKIVQHGGNGVLLGAGGCGKTVIAKRLLHSLVKMYGQKAVIAAAYTGAAAEVLGSNGIRATTLHKAFHLNPQLASGTMEKVIEHWSSHAEIAAEMRGLKVLLVDEFSLVPTTLLLLLDVALRRLRSSIMVFGGVQVIMVGDPMQLPPVEAAGRGRPCYLEPLFRHFFDYYSLEHNYRQQAADPSETAFKALLHTLRLEGVFNPIAFQRHASVYGWGEDVREMLRTKNVDMLRDFVVLCARRDDVAHQNETWLPIYVSWALQQCASAHPRTSCEGSDGAQARGTPGGRAASAALTMGESAGSTARAHARAATSAVGNATVSSPRAPSAGTAATSAPRSQSDARSRQSSSSTSFSALATGGPASERGPLQPSESEVFPSPFGTLVGSAFREAQAHLHTTINTTPVGSAASSSSLLVSGRSLARASPSTPAVQMANETTAIRIVELRASACTPGLQIGRANPTVIVLEKLLVALGAPVMMLENDVGERYANGSIGWVHSVNVRPPLLPQDDPTDCIVVRFPDRSTAGTRSTSSGPPPEQLSRQRGAGRVARSSAAFGSALMDAEGSAQIGYRLVKVGRVLARNEAGTKTFRQFPLQLAFASTVHKAQGHEFRAVLVLRPWQMTTEGQLYTALSRVKSCRAVAIDVLPPTGENGAFRCGQLHVKSAAAFLTEVPHRLNEERRALEAEQQKLCVKYSHIAAFPRRWSLAQTVMTGVTAHGEPTDDQVAQAARTARAMGEEGGVREGEKEGGEGARDEEEEEQEEAPISSAATARGRHRIGDEAPAERQGRARCPSDEEDGVEDQEGHICAAASADLTHRRKRTRPSGVRAEGGEQRERQEKEKET